jgi:hypothetical protein
MGAESQGPGSDAVLIPFVDGFFVFLTAPRTVPRFLTPCRN